MTVALTQLSDLLVNTGWGAVVRTVNHGGWLSVALIHFADSADLPIRLADTGYLMQVDTNAVVELCLTDVLAEIRLFLQTEDPHGTRTNILISAYPLTEVLSAVEAMRLPCAAFSTQEVTEIGNSKVPLQVFASLLASRSEPADISDFDPTDVAHPRVFCDRQPELNKVLRRDNTAFIVTGPRRVGKSSFAHAIVRELNKKRRHAVSLNCLYHRSVHDVLGMLFREWIEPTVTLRKLYEGRDYVALFRQLELSRGGPVHLVMDEVDTLLKNDRRGLCDFLEAARVAQTSHHGRVILVGWKELLRFTSDVNNPIYRTSIHITLGNLHATYARELILKPSRLYHVQFEDEDAIVNELLHLSGGHPYFITVLCAGLMQGLSRDRRIIRIADVREEKRSLLRETLATLRTNTSYLEELMVHLGVRLAEPFLESTLRDMVEERLGKIDSKLWPTCMEQLQYLDVIEVTGYRVLFRLPLLRDQLLRSDYDLEGRVKDLVADLKAGKERGAGGE